MNKRKDEFKRKAKIDFDGFVGSDGIAHEPADCIIRSDVPNGWELMDREAKRNYVKDVYAFWIVRLWVKKMTVKVDDIDVLTTISNWNNFINAGVARLDSSWNEIVDAMNVVIGLKEDVKRPRIIEGAEEVSEAEINEN